jgi:hypothetical protein
MSAESRRLARAVHLLVLIFEPNESSAFVREKARRLSRKTRAGEARALLQERDWPVWLAVRPAAHPRRRPH